MKRNRATKSERKTLGECRKRQRNEWYEKEEGKSRSRIKISHKSAMRRKERDAYQRKRENFSRCGRRERKN